MATGRCCQVECANTAHAAHTRDGHPSAPTPPLLHTRTRGARMKHPDLSSSRCLGLLVVAPRQQWEATVRPRESACQPRADAGQSSHGTACVCGREVELHGVRCDEHRWQAMQRVCGRGTQGRARLHGSSLQPGIHAQLLRHQHHPLSNTCGTAE